MKLVARRRWATSARRSDVTRRRLDVRRAASSPSSRPRATVDRPPPAGRLLASGVTPEDERALVCAAQYDGSVWRPALVDAYLPLITSVARGFPAPYDRRPR